jgi:hypothetical protein
MRARVGKTWTREWTRAPNWACPPHPAWKSKDANSSVFLQNSDYINPIDLCNRLNTYIVPEASVHAFLTFLFLINGYWVALILNLPLLAWNGKKYVLHALCDWQLSFVGGSYLTPRQDFRKPTSVGRDGDFQEVKRA